MMHRFSAAVTLLLLLPTAAQAVWHARSCEEIEMVFDRNKSAIDALYRRALREDRRIVSTELNDSELECKLVARIRMFRFEDKDVEAMITTEPIEFFPA